MTSDENEARAAWVDLGRAVSNARGRLGRRGWTQQELADAIEVSVKTVNTLEAGRAKGMRASTKAKLEDALGWMEGDVDRVLAGGQPRRRPNWTPGEGDVTEENPRPEGEIDRSSVGAVEERDSFVGTGTGGTVGISDEEILQRLDRMRIEQEELAEIVRRRLQGGSGT